MNLTDHDNVAQGAMPEPTKAHQAEYYRLYDEIEAEFNAFNAALSVAPYKAQSRLIHAEVVRRMGVA